MIDVAVYEIIIPHNIECTPPNNVFLWHAHRRPEYDGRAAQISIVTDEGSGGCQAGC